MCARPASQAIAGYYKTPVEQLPLIAGRLSIPPAGTDARIAALDPCAGDGEAVDYLARAVTRPIAVEAERAEVGPRVERAEKRLADARKNAEQFGAHDPDGYWRRCVPEAVAARDAFDEATCAPRRLPADVYAVEVERGRFEALQRLVPGSARALHTDAFCVEFDRSDDGGVGLLLLNSPYDQDPDARGARLEEKFLARFAPALAPRGVLVLIVPHYSLAASAGTIARMFQDVACYRFAAGGFDVFKQVVLFARRREADLPAPDAGVAFLLNAWAENAMGLPELPQSGAPGPRWEVPLLREHCDALRNWRAREVDLAALLAAHRPWRETPRGGGLAPVARALPPGGLAGLAHRTYDVAVPPRPAHIAAGLAAGLFNGQRVEADDSSSGLPPLLVKGVFDREWRDVEEKTNKHGEVTSVVQVQAPHLRVTALDLRQHRYATLREDVKATGATDVGEMSVGDLLAGYGRSLVSVMARQCRILYDRRGEDGAAWVAGTPRAPYAAQADAIRALVKLCGEHPESAAVLDGEVGVGKASVSLLVAKTLRKRRPLVLCPPHLLENWAREVAVVTPEAEVRVLATPADVDALAREPLDVRVVAVLSREAAKLGHAYEGVSGACPRCGGRVPAGVDFAKKRARCVLAAHRPADDIARLAREVALQARAHAPADPHVAAILAGRLDAQRAEALSRRSEGRGRKPPGYAGLPAGLVLRLRAALLAQCKGEGAVGETTLRALARLACAAPDAGFVADALAALYRPSAWQRDGEDIVALAPVAGRPATRVALRALPERQRAHVGATRDELPVERAEQVWRALDGKDDKAESHRVAGLEVTLAKGVLSLDGKAAGSLGAALALLESLVALGGWSRDAECGEFLYQASPAPRRYPLAKYILRRHPRLFDFLILDEAHEANSDTSAQGHAARRLVALGLPTLSMTGTLVNGYAKSLFPMLWALSPRFREEFDRDESSAFVDRYGYRKRVLQDREEGEVVAFGSHSDRVERSERDVGDAPGVLPLLLFRHILPMTVTLQKEDLRIDIPPLSQARVESLASGDLAGEYRRLLSALRTRIKADRFKEGLSGKLFGALAELPSFLDRATEDVGNAPGGGSYEVRYPESCGGALVASARLLPARTVLPKEADMLAFVEAELAEGRNVLVFGWHLALLPRLARLVEERTGEKCPVLYADKVPTAKRQAWIEKEIVGKKRRVMVCNPVCIQTGLNSLVHFASEWWHEDCACNPLIRRQAIGRIDRIGQRLPTRVRAAYYAGTLQENVYDLLLHKVAVSTAVDGLDPEGALLAAGVESSEYMTGMSIGKQLWAMMQEEGADLVDLGQARARRASSAR